MYCVPGRALLDIDWHVHLLILRLWHLQYIHRKDICMHKQVRLWTVLQHGRICLLVVRCWLVQQRKWRL
jgi:hypothetical protein